MAARKKRTPSPKSAHIAVQSHVSSLEDDDPVAPPATATVEEHHEVISQQDSNADTSLEEMLAKDAIEPELTKKNKLVYTFGLIVTFGIVILTISTYFVYLRSSKTPVASATPSGTPTPIPTITVDPKSISIEVLNASGVAGKASKTAEELKARGYTIASTGNSKKIPGTSVMFAPALSDRAKEMILTDLQSIGISSISSTIGDASVSARLTLGLK